ncbi:hypothetical protein GALL_382050 [mine drainage metagenome]|uniref:Uncharacterized protein n=1 Tax=mine drainage metagenome TaxID=410659 RepID=A0A1J5Q9J1_9ZZZZ
MRGREVLRHGGEAAAMGAPGVGGDALAAVQQFDAAGGQPRLQLRADQVLRHAVAMAVDLDVVVDVHPHRLVAGPFPGLRGQRLQRRRVDGGEHRGAAAGQLLEQPGVEPVQQRRDRLVDVVDGTERLLAQPHQDPAFDHLHSRFDLGLVLRPIGARRQHRGAVVPGEVLDGLVGARLVAVRIGDQGARVVGDDELRHAPDEPQRLRTAVQPVGQGLPRCGAGVGEARCAQRRDEDVGHAFAFQRDRGAGVVDEQLLPGAVDLPHRPLQPQAVAVVVLAELGVAPRRLVRMGLDVLLPQQGQGHALAAHLLVHQTEVGGDVVARAVGAAGQQPALQRRLAELGHGRPIQPAGCRQDAVLGDGALGDAERRGDALVREPGLKLQT